jgi:NAD(P)H-flavin reductase
VLTLRLDQPMRYRAGQHLSIQVPRWPRVWREYSIANAPAPDGLLRLHVRAVPCGLVSTVLVHQTAPGETLVAGPARGDMTVAAMAAEAALGQPGRRVACFAGGTGLAPVKAVVEELAATRPAPVASILLFFGARHEAGLYDLPELRRLAESCPALTVIPVISDDPGYRGIRGTLAQAAGVHLPPGTQDVFISGPPGMVRATAEAAAARCPGARLHFDPPPGADALCPVATD